MRHVDVTEELSEDKQELIVTRDMYKERGRGREKNIRMQWRTAIMTSNLDVLPKEVRVLIAIHLDSFLYCQLHLHRHRQLNTIEFYRNRKLYQLLMVQYDSNFPVIMPLRMLISRYENGEVTLTSNNHYVPREDLRVLDLKRKKQSENIKCLLNK